MSASCASAPLGDLLAASLPRGFKFTFYNCSTPPTRCAAIYAAPPNGKPERTYCESHFLNVSLRPPNSSDELLFLAIEILIYTTKHITTLFVSKADSTGYLSLLRLPKSHASPLRSITTTFISYLIRHRQRPGKKLVLSLFARAQDQYLFPGSVENPSKHVSTDRELVRWWCRVVDPILQEYGAEDKLSSQGEDKKETTAQGYLIVPGEDSSASFLPPSVRSNPSLRKRWTQGHPLRDICSHPQAPPRCLVPRFPDDPKSRFLDELDSELRDATNNNLHESPSKRGNGMWRSIRSLEQFWEMMTFRQECSSGRLVGFLWVVFTPPDEGLHGDENGLGESQTSSTSHISEFDRSSSPTPGNQSSPKPRRKPRERRKLSGPVIPRLPRIKKAASELSTISNTPSKTPYYSWPVSSRGTIILEAKEYNRAMELLHKLDFANLEIASASTAKWIEEVGILGGVPDSKNWGFEVTGQKEATVPQESIQNGNAMMLKPKRKADALEKRPDPVSHAANDGTNVLGAGLVRKKAKIEKSVLIEQSSTNTVDAPPAVNVLGAGLIRKKPKAQ
ncbi:DUF1714-domain-containing protein [Rhizodiscina lignyota]|uniref:histone acetyltransferase n=1 Tax=Rhizodiscina lignyota TaxID=1504668 RepID=A0A9P4I6X9_9PEZI|nr:DUF1714-domain-containing protein [Rhizodiscina lignyota]